jgi:hypothetical protein
MNCKQGDMAVVIRSIAGNEGKIVSCLRFVPAGSFIPGTKIKTTGDGWEIDVHIRIADRNTRMILGTAPWAIDCALMPIRDIPGEDETLTWAGKPKLKEFVK